MGGNRELLYDSTQQNDDTLVLTQAQVTVQCGSAGTFEFTIPPTHRFFQRLKRLIFLVDVYRDDDDDPLFSGRIYSITDTMDGQQKVSCEGMLAALSDGVYRPTTYQGQLHGLVANILQAYNSTAELKKRIQVGNLTIPDTGVYRAYETYESCLVRIKDLVETFGGYLMVQKRNGTYYLDWLSDYTTPCTQEVILGSNLLDIQKSIDSDGIATILIPLGAKDDDGNRLTIKSVNSGRDYLDAATNYVIQYGYVVRTVIFDDVTVPANLKTKGQDYLTACLSDRTAIKLKAVDLADAGYSVDSFRVGQKISVTSEPHGLHAVFFNCLKQRLNLLQPAQNTLELGETKVGYVQTQRATNETMLRVITEEIARNRNVLQVAINTATALISGNQGGYVVMHDSNDDGYPDEILVMDTPSINTAVKVWRWNNSGLGYSSTGYNGTYETAITIQGQIVANFITAGTMSADRIQGGTLILGGYNNEYGVLVIKNADGKIVQRTNNAGTTFWDKYNNFIGTIYYADSVETSDVLGHVYFRLYGDRMEFYDSYHNNKSTISSTEGLIASNSNGELSYLRSDLFHMVSAGHQNVEISPVNGLVFFTDTTACSIKPSGAINGTSLYISGTKNRVVSTKDYGDRLYYCYETATPLFGDLGEGIIGDDGIAYIWLDPILAQSITTDGYQVFLQKYGAGEAYVSDRTGACFTVCGTPGMRFGWELKAKQADFDQRRLDTYREEQTQTTANYGLLALNHIKSLQEGRIYENSDISNNFS